MQMKLNEKLKNVKFWNLLSVNCKPTNSQNSVIMNSGHLEENFPLNRIFSSAPLKSLFFLWILKKCACFLIWQLLHALQFWLWPKFWSLTDPLQGKGSILESWTLMDLGDKDPFDIFFKVGKVQCLCQKVFLFGNSARFLTFVEQERFYLAKCKQHTSWGNKNVQNWQNVNSVLLGSDTIPTNACLTGNGILQGSDAVQPFG